ncbi:MAG: Ig-like domain-containing protein, partial [Thermoplasmata archaeon]
AIGHDSFHHETPYAEKWETNDPRGSINSSGVYYPGMVGTWRVYCNNTNDSISNYTVVNVLPGNTSRIGIDPWDPGTLTTDDNLLFNATAYDSKGNSRGPVVANWTITGSIGSISPGPNSFALFNPTQPGSGTISADDGNGHANTTNIIQVVIGARASVGIDPWSPGTLTAEETLNFTASGYDADGNQIGPAIVNWTVNGGIGNIAPGPSDNSTFEATTVGMGTVTIDDGLGRVNTTDLITVTAGALNTLEVLPNPVVMEHGETQDFSATGYDSYGNIVTIVDSIWQTNAGTIVFSSAEMATLEALDSELTNGWITVTAILQNNVSGSANVSVVVTNVKPIILGTIPNQLKPEDYGAWSLDLSSFASDPQDPASNLTWYFTNHDSSLTSISGDNVIGNHVITFTTVPNAYGSDELSIWLRDKDGYTDSQTLYTNITSVNDNPTIQSITPFTVHYDVPYNYYFYDYVSDVETSKEDLTMSTSEPDYISFDGLWGTFGYPQEFDGLTVYPIVTVHDEDGGEMSTVIAITVSDDYVPVLIIELPDVVLNEGEEVLGYFDLDDYFEDPDRDSLFYTSGNVHVDITINEDHTVDFKAPVDWSGTETVSFRAIDPFSARAEDIVLITVIPVNDPPIISGVPDLVVRYDDPGYPEYNYTFDLAPYVHDVDNDTSELVISTNDATHIFFYDGQNTVMDLHYPQSMSGQTIAVRITVSDGLSSDHQDINITIMDNWPPELSSTIPDVSFYEDTTLPNAFKIDDYFTDPDGDELTFSSLSSNVLIHIDNSTLYVTLSSTQDWFGVEYVTFKAMDTNGALAEQTVKVTVFPVNDAPVIREIPDLTVRKDQIFTLDLTQYVYDIDNTFSDLIIRAYGDYSKTPILAGYVLIFSYSEEGTDQVQLEVSDGDKTVYVMFNVRIVSPPPPSFWDQIYWPWSLITALLAAAILVIFARWFFAKIHIDEAFLIYRSGSLINHCVIERRSDIDEDIFSNMLTAIQEFIKDSFREMEDAPVKKIEFGKQKIIIERGKSVYLAVVYNGFETRRNLQPIKDATKEIEKKYRKELESWDGFIFRFSGVENIIRKHLGELKTSEGAEIGQRKSKERTATPPESTEHETEGESDLEEAFK